jgi:hypothetical protein
MRKLVVSAVVTAFVLGAMSPSAFAIIPFSKEFAKLYVEPAKDSPFAKEVEKVKCNVCHEGTTSKKMRNEYGMAVGKLLKKADFGPDKLKDDPEGTSKAIAEALKKVEGEKSKDGKTFGEKIKAGKLPGA